MAPLDIDTALDWRGRTVVDRDGEKIGKLDELYLDESDQPAWGAITTGMFGRRQSFVPLSELQPDGDDLRVPFDKDRVKDAPSVEPDAQLSGEDEDRLYRHYGIGIGGGGSEARDAGDAGDADDDGTGAVAADAGAREDRVPAADAEPRGDRVAADDVDEVDRGERDGGEGAEMIRSEEEVSIGTRRRATHRARLKKYVVTEHVKKVVPVQREEVRVEYEPTGDGDAATEGREPVRGDVTSADDAAVRDDSGADREAVVTDDSTVDRDRTAEGTAGRARTEAERGDDRGRGLSAGERDRQVVAGAGAEEERGDDPVRGDDRARGVDSRRALSAGERDREVVAGGGPEDLDADRAFESEDMSRADRDADRADDETRDRRLD
jgi:stress response protein YsnF